MIGEAARNKTLHSIAKATGGYSFAPKDLQNALCLMELETFLCSHERPTIPPSMVITTQWQLASYLSSLYDECEGGKVPTRKLPELLKAPVMSVEKTLNSHVGKDSRIRRLLEDMKFIMKNPNPDYEVFPCQNDIAFWRVLLKGPSSRYL